MENTPFNLLTGKGWNFYPQFDEFTKAALLVSGAEDIRQSLFILFNTVPGERMNPDYGCALRQFLFGIPTLAMITRMQDMVDKAILRFEPRIQADPVKVDTSQLAEGTLLLDITYTVLGLNTRNNIVFPFHLNEGTLL